MPPRTLWNVLAAFVSSRALVVAGILTASKFVAPGPTPADAWHPANGFLAPFFNWDANYYMQVATYGYGPAPSGIHPAAYRAAFFPLYPFLVSLLSHVLGDPSWSALLISNVALLLTMFVVRSLGDRLLGDRTANAAVWILAFFPWSLFLSLPYTEVLLMLLLAIALWLADGGRWLWAGVAGMAAATARAPGLLTAALPLTELARRWFSQKPRAGLGVLILAAALPGLGWVIVGLVQKISMGDPLGFIHGQMLWIGPRRNPFFLVGSMVTIALRRDFTDTEFFGFPCMVCFLVAVIWLARRVPPHYYVLAILMFGLAVVQTLNLRQAIALPRYLMTDLPCYFAFGALFARLPRWVLPAWLVVSGVLLFWLSGLFASWRFVG
jgi:Mannosyltransferase (PIG-V)